MLIANYLCKPQGKTHNKLSDKKRLTIPKKKNQKYQTNEKNPTIRVSLAPHPGQFCLIVTNGPKGSSARAKRKRWIGHFFVF